MDFHHLRYFIEIINCKSYTKAAEKLYITQPTLTRAINQLEEELGTTLLVRAGKNFKLTDAGNVFYDRAVVMLEQYDELFQTISDIKNMRRGEISFAGPGVMLSMYFPKILSGFHKQYPDIRITVREEGTMDALRSALRGEVDFSMIAMPAGRSSLETRQLLRDTCQVLVRRDHELAGHSTISAKDLVQEQLVTFSDTSVLYSEIRSHFEKSGVAANIVYNAPVPDLMVDMVRRENCVAVLPSTVIKPYLTDEFVYRPFVPEIRWDIGIAWGRERYRSYAAICFSDFVYRYFRDSL